MPNLLLNMIFIAVHFPNYLSFWEIWFLTWYQSLVFWEVQGLNLGTSISYPPYVNPESVYSTPFHVRLTLYKWQKNFNPIFEIIFLFPYYIPFHLLSLFLCSHFKPYFSYRFNLNRSARSLDKKKSIMVR